MTVVVEGSGCPNERAGPFDTPEELALVAACNEADHASLVLRDFNVERVSGDDLRAEVRVVANELSCDGGCPRQMEYTLNVFVNTNGEWKADEASGWSETGASVQARDRAHAQEVFDSLTYVVRDTTARIDGFGLYTLDVDAELTPPGDAIRVWLLIEFEDGRMAVVSSPNGHRFQFDRVPPEDAALHTLPTDAEDLGGQVVTLKQYRLGVAYGLNETSRDFEYIKTDWTPIP